MKKTVFQRLMAASYGNSKSLRLSLDEVDQLVNILAVQDAALRDDAANKELKELQQALESLSKRRTRGPLNMSCGVPGVCFTGGRWQSYGHVGKRRTWLYSGPDKLKAVECRKEWEARREQERQEHRRTEHSGFAPGTGDAGQADPGGEAEAAHQE